MGSCFIRHLYRTYPNYRIVNFDLLTYAGNLDNLVAVEEREAILPEAKRRYRFIRGDIILSQHALDLIIRKLFVLIA